MKKNVFISLLILVAFIFLAYLVISNAPERKNIPPANNQENVFLNDQMQVEVSAPEMMIIREGEGEQTSSAGDTLSVFYTGYLIDGTTFDSNVGGNEFQFTIGAGEVISGWEIGLIDMKVGEVRRIVLPPDYGYGDMQVGQIPPNSVLIFDVELKSINKAQTPSGASAESELEINL